MNKTPDKTAKATGDRMANLALGHYTVIPKGIRISYSTLDASTQGAPKPGPLSLVPTITVCPNFDHIPLVTAAKLNRYAAEGL